MKIKHINLTWNSCMNCKFCEWWYEYYRCNHEEWEDSHELGDEPDEFTICDKFEKR